MLNISVIPQRKYNLAPSVINKLYNPQGAKVSYLIKNIGQNPDLLVNVVVDPLFSEFRSILIDLIELY